MPQQTVVPEVVHWRDGVGDVQEPAAQDVEVTEAKRDHAATPNSPSPDGPTEKTITRKLVNELEPPDCTIKV